MIGSKGASESLPPSNGVVQRGGPKTSEGKSVSRANAIKHGLCSKEMLPDILGSERLEAYREKVIREFNPTTITEDILVNELARHAAMLEVGERAEGSVLRHGASELSKVLVGDDADDVSMDAVLTAAVSSDAIERFARYRRGHEKAFYAALNQLRELQAANWRRHRPDPKPADSRFETESACEVFLKKRFDVAGWACPRCGSSQGHWLAKRSCWECANCQKQVGLRAGTVMARSPLPLVAWFAAIEMVVENARVPAKRIADTIGIRRMSTVRSIIGRIRDALASDNTTELLIGLDETLAT